MSELSIRPMGPEDYDTFDRFLGQLHRLHQAARPDLFRPAEHPLPPDWFRQRLEDPNNVFLLAEVDGRPAGMCLFEFHDGSRDPLLFPVKEVYINDLFVAEEYRRQGIATALYREAERIGADRGAKQISLMVWAFNESARRFYEKLGLNVRTFTMEKEL